MTSSDFRRGTGATLITAPTGEPGKRGWTGQAGRGTLR
nr:hypothetical protein [Kibdelosporangium sp. MJ126-NF4]CTQ93522.1 hypothetical protein [Kibdelosporangium sp. MJ126-NF4]